MGMKIFLWRKERIDFGSAKNGTQCNSLEVTGDWRKFYNEDNKGDERGGTCNVYGGENKCLQGVVGETGSKETSLKTWMKIFFIWRNSPQWAKASPITRFLDHTQRRNTVGKAHLDGWSARRRDLYLTTYNIHSWQTSMPPRWDSKPRS